MKTLVILGGGIAGVSCAQELIRVCEESCRIVLISLTETLMETSSVIRLTHHLEEISVFERTAEQFKLNNTGIEIILGEVLSVNYLEKKVYLTDSREVPFDRLCICTGARPKLIHPHPNIIGLRDLQSIENLLEHVKVARRIAIVGNGGIALELIHQLHMCHIDWIVREDYIGSAFFDATASEFILPKLLQRKLDDSIHIVSSSSQQPSSSSSSKSPRNIQYGGYGLGPQWMEKSHFHSKLQVPATSTMDTPLKIHFETEVHAVSDNEGKTWTVLHPQTDSVVGKEEEQAKCAKQSNFPILLKLSNNQIIECDFVISATGVQPNTNFLLSSSQILTNADIAAYQPTKNPTNPSIILLDEEGYVLVNDRFQSFNQSDVFAAGDCCSYHPFQRTTQFFYQMKLWTQARIMGMYVAQCMANVEEEYGNDSQLELFAHITRFFGYKVVLLGRYNGQGLGEFKESAIKRTMVITRPDNTNASFTTKIVTNSQSSNGKMIVDDENEAKEEEQEHALEIWIRIIPDKEYIKLIVLQGKVVGALLIGDTDLEEVFENLILNQLDVSAFGMELLNPDNDIEDFFD